MIEQKCDGLLIENNELKKKILTLEIEIEGQKPKTAQDPEMNVLKSEIVSLKKQLADKEETILMLENTVQKIKDEQLNSSKSSEVSRLRRKAE
jgi:capsule polysaccharide export protein KpsE/RkpR